MENQRPWEKPETHTNNGRDLPYQEWGVPNYMFVCVLCMCFLCMFVTFCFVVCFVCVVFMLCVLCSCCFFLFRYFIDVFALHCFMIFGHLVLFVFHKFRSPEGPFEGHFEVMGPSGAPWDVPGVKNMKKKQFGTEPFGPRTYSRQGETAFYEKAGKANLTIS